MRLHRTHLRWLLLASLFFSLAAPAVASATSVKLYVYGPGRIEMWAKSDGAPDLKCIAPDSTPTGVLGQVCESPDYGFGQYITLWSGGPHSHYGSPGNQCANVRNSSSCGFTVWGVGTATVHSYFVDTVAPETRIISSPPATINITQASFAFTATQEGSTFQCRLDAGAWTPCSSPHSYMNLTQGAHTVAVAATDASGNRDDSPATASFNVDSVAPTVTNLEGPYGWAAGRGRFTFASENGASFACRNYAVGSNPPAFSTCGSGVEMRASADGAQLFEVTATDQARNTSAPIQWRWGSDTTAPSLEITDGPVGRTITSRTAQFTWNSSDISGTVVICTLDGTDVPCDSRTGHRLTDLTDGPHTFAVLVRDSVQLAASTSRTFAVDATAPTAVITAGPADGAKLEATTATFELDAGETDATLFCSLDGAEFTSCTSPVTYSSLALGAHTFAVRSADKLGNTQTADAATSRSWTIVAPAPVDNGNGNGGTGTGNGTGTGTNGNDTGAGNGTGGGANGSGAPSGGSAPGGQTPGGAQADRTAPIVQLVATRSMRVNAKTKQLAVKVTCSEACTLTLGASAKAGKRTVKLAPRTVKLAAGRTTVVWVTVPKALRSLVAQQRAGARVTFTASASDAAGNVAKRTASSVAKR